MRQAQIIHTQPMGGLGASIEEALSSYMKQQNEQRDSQDQQDRVWASAQIARMKDMNLGQQREYISSLAQQDPERVKRIFGGNVNVGRSTDEDFNDALNKRRTSRVNGEADPNDPYAAIEGRMLTVGQKSFGESIDKNQLDQAMNGDAAARQSAGIQTGRLLSAEDSGKLTEENRHNLQTEAVEKAKAAAEAMKAGAYVRAEKLRGEAEAALTKLRGTQNEYTEEGMKPGSGRQQFEIGIDKAKAESAAAASVNKGDPHARGIIEDFQPTLDQVNKAITALEPYKNSKDRITGDYVGYLTGNKPDDGSPAAQIARLSMLRAKGGSQIMRGGTRSIVALKAAWQHTPNPAIDRLDQMYSKLLTMRDYLDGIVGTARQFAGPIPGEQPAAPQAQPNTPQSPADEGATNADAFLRQLGIPIGAH